MTEPPRPPGDDPFAKPPTDPTSPLPPASYPMPGEAPGYAPPPGAPQQPYAPPPQDPYGAQPGGYPQQGGYPQGGYPQGGYPPAGGPGYGAPGYATSDDKTWALVAHFGGAAAAFVSSGTGGWIPPLIALLAKGQQSPTVRAHAVAALNFQLLWSIICVVSWILTCILIGFIGVLAAWALGTIFGIIAGLKANEGQLYKYPMSINMIK